MQSKAKTVKEYLASLPEERRAVIQQVRKVILKNLDKGYQEGMQYGAIGYFVKRSVFPQGYHCDPRQPLPFAGLGSQKHYFSVGLMCHYYESESDSWFRSAWLKTGKKLDMGKCCIRFRTIEDVALEVLAEAVRRVPAKRYVAIYLAARGGRSMRKPAATRDSAMASKRSGRPKTQASAASNRTKGTKSSRR